MIASYSAELPFQGAQYASTDELVRNKLSAQQKAAIDNYCNAYGLRTEYA